MFTKRIFWKCKIPMVPYLDRCAFLGINTLEQRRIIADQTMLYKITNNLTPLNFEDFFTYSCKNLRGHSSLKLKSKFTAKSKKVASFFTFRSLHEWNNLPPSVRTSPTLGSFKNAILKQSFKTSLLRRVWSCQRSYYRGIPNLIVLVLLYFFMLLYFLVLHVSALPLLWRKINE
jgi:hypothetical protein